ncbi:MAG: cell division protein FtsQ/DivIB [Clostridia bacterium]
MIEKKYGSGNSITTTHDHRNVSKKKRTSHYFFIIVLLVMAIVLTSLFTPLFNITNIKIEGMEKVTQQVILDVSGIEKDMNIFHINLNTVRNHIGGIPYIDSVKIKRKLPNTVIITIVERKPVGCIPFMGSYIFIDAKGNVLEVASQIENQDIPIINGLKFNEFKMGERIKVDEENKLDIIVSCVKELINSNLLDKTGLIDVHDVDNIQLNIEGRIVVNMGDVSRMRHKMEFLVAILNEIKSEQKGFIDLSVEKPVLSVEN